MKRTILAGVLALLILMAGGPIGAETPIGWRHDGTGAFPTATPPTEWSSEKNVKWKVPLPGASWGTPVVVGDNLFLVSDPSEVLCVRRSDGKVLWKKSHSDVKATESKGGFGKGGFGKGGFGKGKGGFGKSKGGANRMSAGNSAATPVSDGKYVAAVFGNGVVAVYTVDGTRVWARQVETSQIGFGHSASPVLIGTRLIVHIRDLVAVDVGTGKELWRTPMRAGHASPVPARVGKEDVVISPTGAVVRASDGKVVARGEFRAVDSSAVVVGDTLYSIGSGAYRLAARDDGAVTVKAVWTGGEASTKDNRRIPSPVIHDGLMYQLTTRGFLEVVDAKTGDQVYRQRLSVGQVYSSLALAGGLVYAFDLDGKAVVFKAGRKYEPVATNRLEGTGSCPTFAGDHLYVRGDKHLYCLSVKPAKKEEKKEK